MTRKVRGRVAPLIAIAIAMGLSGCNLFSQLFGIGSTDITAIASKYVDGTPSIDTTNHTVSLKVFPVDVSKLTLDISASSGATVSTPVFKDGQPVDVVVTAKNGATQTWQITVNVDFGMSFDLSGAGSDSGFITLTHGAVDQTGSDNASYGNDVPSASLANDYGDIALGAAKSTVEFDINSADAPYTMVFIYLYDTSAGTYYEENEDLTFDYESFDSSDTQIFDYNSSSDSGANYITVTLDSIGSQGDVVTGSFSGKTEDFVSETKIGTVANGYFKLKQIQDDSPEYFGAE